MLCRDHRHLEADAPGGLHEIDDAAVIQRFFRLGDEHHMGASGAAASITLRISSDRPSKMRSATVMDSSFASARSSTMLTTRASFSLRRRDGAGGEFPVLAVQEVLLYQRPRFTVAWCKIDLSIVIYRIKRNIATMNYKHLYYFWWVATAGGVVKAGEKLHITPHTISGKIGLFS